MGSESRLFSFQLEAVQLLGEPQVMADSDGLRGYRANVGTFRREVPLVVYPRTTDEVVALVGLANTHGVPLSPISTGRNWGLGSRLPAADGCVVVDLGRMRKIRTVDGMFGYAVVEPGVTQGQLADHLAEIGCPFFVDVTGSGRDTSLVGNSLERGVGYNTPRVDTLLDLEIVLGTGQVLHTGYAHFRDARVTHLSPYGIGPSLTGLFFQSNFGIVTAATLKLQPRHEHVVLFTLEISSGGLAPAIDALRELKRQDVIPGIVHVANRRRRDISLSPMVFDYYRSLGRPQTRERISSIIAAAISGDWAALGHVAGDPGRCRAATRQIGRILGKTGKVKFMTRRKLGLLRAVAGRLRRHDTMAMLTGLGTLFEVMHGKPTDESLKSVYWPRSTESADFRDPDRGGSGLLYCVPLIPMLGTAAIEAAEIAERVTRRFAFSAAVTLNTLHATCLEGVVSFDFDKADAGECDRAAECLKALSAAYRDRGFYPLRLDIDGMRSVFDESDVFWQTAQALKRTLDPRGIVAPSRYQLR